MNDFLNTPEDDNNEQAQQATGPSCRDFFEKDVSLTPYAIDLHYPGCKSAEEADKMCVFLENEAELDEFLALFNLQTGYAEVVKEAEDIDGPITAPAEFLIPRIFFSEKSTFNENPTDIAIRNVGLWWSMKFGCQDGEKVLRELIAAS